MQLTGVDIFACPACENGRLVPAPFEPIAVLAYGSPATFDTS